MPGKVEKTSKESHEGDITGLDYSNKSDLLYTAGGDGKVKVRCILFFFKLIKIPVYNIN